MAARNGIDQKDIVRTLRDVATFILDLDIGKANNKQARNWLTKGQPTASDLETIHTCRVITEAAILTTTPSDIDEQKRQGELIQSYASKVSAIVNKYGYPNVLEHVSGDDFSYFLHEDHTQEGNSLDPMSYWPGCLIPTLMEYERILKFCAYRDMQDGVKDSKAQDLIDRVNAFKGFHGSTHASMTSAYQEQSDFIAATDRHPCDQYIEPEDVKIDEANSGFYAYEWTEDQWLPAGKDMVEARIVLGGGEPWNTADVLGGYKASIAFGLERANIDAGVSVEYGKTYGEDAVVVRMNDREYQKYIDVKTGKRALAPVHDELNKASTRSFYSGYQHGAKVFSGPEGEYIRKDVFDDVCGNNTAATRELEWLRASGRLTETSVTLSDNSAAEKEYRVLNNKEGISTGVDVHYILDRYWEDLDVYNTASSTIRYFSARAAGEVGDDVAAYPDAMRDQSLSSIWFENAGKIFIPAREEFKQVAMHFNAVSGVAYDTVSLESNTYYDQLNRPDSTRMYICEEETEFNKKYALVRHMLRAEKETHGRSYMYVIHADKAADADAIRRDVTEALNAVKADLDRGESGVCIPSLKALRP